MGMALSCLVTGGPHDPTAKMSATIANGFLQVAIPVTVRHVFNEDGCGLNGFIYGNNKDALQVQTQVRINIPPTSDCHFTFLENLDRS